MFEKTPGRRGRHGGINGQYAAPSAKTWGSLFLKFTVPETEIQAFPAPVLTLLSPQGHVLLFQM